MPALFKARKEAEKAAKSLNCTGAHKMGNKWKPCATNGLANKPIPKITFLSKNFDG